MMNSSNDPRRSSVAPLLVSCLVLLISVPFIDAFAQNVPGKEFRRASRPSVQTSLSTPSKTIASSSSSREDERGKDVDDNGKDMLSHRSNHRTSFRNHLRVMTQSTRSKVTLANRMDDELKRMEIRFFNISPEKAPVCRYEETDHSYKGPAVEPDVSCYAMVANAYAKAGLGKVGAELAEAVYQRCQTHSIVQRPNAILSTACLSAWTNADEWKNADSWLTDMEEKFASTGDKFDAPDTVTYTCYLEGLANSRNLKGPDIARRGEAVFQKVLALSASGENPYVKPNRFTYIAAMKCLTREENGIVTLDKAEGLLRELESLYAKTKVHDTKPKSVAYLAVLNTAARCGAGMEGARRAEALLLELQKLSEQDSDYHIQEPCWTACLTAFARVEPEHAAEAAEKVDEILEKMENDTSIRRPSVHVYTAAINAKVNDSDPRSVEEAATILRQLKKPDSVAYKCVIKAFARIGYAAKADNLLWELQNLSVSGSRPRLDPPDVVTIAACINAWAKGHIVDTEVALDRSMKLLDLIIDAYRQGKVAHYHRDVESWIFDEAIRLWSISRRPDSGEQAERLINTMEELTETTGLFKPSFHTYVLALDAWASSGRRDAGTRAVKLLETMENLHAEGTLREAVNMRALSTVLIAVTKSGGRTASSIAQSLFERIVRLYKDGDRSASINARTVTSILACIIRSSDKYAPMQALELLKEIKDLSDSGMDSLKPNTIVYNCVLNGLAQSGMAEEAEGLLEEMKSLSAKGYPCAPDVVTISCVCRAFANSKLPGTGPRAEKYLRESRERFEGGDTQMKPDTRLYNSVITAFVNDAHTNPEAAEKADDLLQEMLMSAAGDNRVIPDLVSFSSVCQAYAKSSDPAGLENAAKVFKRAEQLALEGSMEFPDIIFFSSVVLAFTRSKSEDATKRAEQLVHHMEELSQKGRDVKPNTQVYNTLLSSYATSRDADRVEKATTLFAKMKDMHADGNSEAGPDVSSHNWVILAAARSPCALQDERREHFNLAVEYFREMHEPKNDITKPNSFTYSYFLKACRMLLPEGASREKLAAKAFALGQENGLVMRDVLVEAFLVDPVLVSTELELAGVPFENDVVPFIPEKWCYNVPRRKRYNNIDLQRWHSNAPPNR